MIADGICEVLDRTMHYEYDRHSQRKKRDKNEIGLHAVRGGTIVGEHEVLFAGHHETLSLTHVAQSKKCLQQVLLMQQCFWQANLQDCTICLI